MNCENLVDIKCLQGSKQRVLTDSLWTEKFRWGKNEKKCDDLGCRQIILCFITFN